jgi:hypothetical protein
MTKREELRREEEFKKKQGQNAAVHCNHRFISISTRSGAGILGIDLQGAHHLLSPDASDEALGHALLDALSKSRRISSQEDPAFSGQGLEESNKIWRQQLMDQYQYKNRQQLFKNMVRCGIRLADGFITMKPLRHEGLEGWGGMDPALNIVLSGEASPATVGAALRLALDRCIP